MRPLALTDDQLDAVRRAAEPLAPDLRAPFLETVARLLAHEPVVGDGSVARACREAQREFWKAPDLSRAAGTSKYR
jgi:hypothetical protein